MAQANSGYLSYDLIQEDSQWRLIETRVVPGQLPRFVRQLSFSRAEEAKDYLRRLNRSSFLRPALSVADLPQQSLSATEVGNASIWRAEHEWDWQWELKYADWIRRNNQADFFSRHGILTDCADVAYAYRWIFARENKLRMASRIPGVKGLFTNESMLREWVKLPTHSDWWQDKRFLAALDYMLKLSYTHSLFQDSYPVRIHPETFREGVFHLSLSEGSGHTLFVTEVNLSGVSRLPIYVSYSTVPRALRRLEGSAFFATPSVAGDTAFLRFLWPRKSGELWRLVRPSEMPDYSEEQFSNDFVPPESTFVLTVMKRINPQFDPVLRITQGVSDLRSMLRQRQEVVDRGYQVCRRTNCSPGTEAFEEWSTPSRDWRILALFADLEDYATLIGSQLDEVQERWLSELKSPAVRLGTEDFNLEEVGLSWRSELFSSDPRVDPEQRWGISPLGLVLSLRNLFRNLMEQRSELVTKSSCRGSAPCPLWSEQYRQEYSGAIDERLFKSYTRADRYCETSSAERCERFLKIWQNLRLPFGRLEKSTADLRRILPWLNADPRAPVAQRWGSLGTELPWREVGEPVVAILTRSDRIIWRDKLPKNPKLGLVILNSADLSVLQEFPAEIEFVDFNPETEQAILMETGSQRIFVYDLGSGTSLPVGLGFDAHWIEKDRLVVTDLEGTSSQIWLVRGRSAQPVGPAFAGWLPKQAWSSRPGEYSRYIARSHLDKVGYLDLSDFEAKWSESQTSIERAGNLILLGFWQQNAIYQEREGGGCLLVHDLLTKRWREDRSICADSLRLLPNSSLLLAVAWGESGKVKAYRLAGPSFGVSEVIELGDFCLYCQGEHLLTFTSPGLFRAFKLSAKAVTEFRPASGERILSYNGPWVSLWRDGKGLVRDSETGDLILERANEWLSLEKPVLANPFLVHGSYADRRQNRYHHSWTLVGFNQDWPVITYSNSSAGINRQDGWQNDAILDWRASARLKLGVVESGLGHKMLVKWQVRN